jgi:hypothetical protein
MHWYAWMSKYYNVVFIAKQFRVWHKRFRYVIWLRVAMEKVRWTNTLRQECYWSHPQYRCYRDKTLITTWNLTNISVFLTKITSHVSPQENKWSIQRGSTHIPKKTVKLICVMGEKRNIYEAMFKSFCAFSLKYVLCFAS